MSGNNIAILGGGLIGEAFYRTNLGNWETASEHRIYDSDPDCMASCYRDNFYCVDILDGSSFAKILDWADYVVNALPIYDVATVVQKIVRPCVEAGVHYLDFTEDERVGDAISAFCESAKPKTLVAPHCGLAPGLVNIIGNGFAQHIVDHGGKVESIDMRVGALPKSYDNSLHYIATWSAKGVHNEYVKPCTIIRRGQLQTTNVWESPSGLSSGYTQFVLNERKYEAFFTSGGCSTMLETWMNRAESVTYRSIRYPGHFDAVNRIMLHDIHLEQNKTLEALERTKTHGVEDVVLLFVQVEGTDKYGDPIRFQKSARIEQKTEGFCRHHLAIQRATAAGAALVYDLHTSGKIKRGGYLKQEDISLENANSSHHYKGLGL